MISHWFGLLAKQKFGYKEKANRKKCVSGKTCGFQYFRETENASPVSDHLHLTEDEMDDIPRDFSCANPVDIPFLDKKFEGRRRSSLAAIHIYKQQLQSSSRKNSSVNADVIRTQIAESTILSSLDSDRVGEGADADDDEECPTQSEQIETKGAVLHSTFGAHK